MTIRRRLTLWYGAVLALSLLLISVGAYHELAEKIERAKKGSPAEDALEETSEISFDLGIPAILLGIAGGWWLTRRALQPLADLTAAAKKIDESTLGQPLPRTGNGDELDDLAGVLNAMQSRLNTSFARIREFTLHASHELKTPLTVMRGEQETALRENPSPAERERILSQLDELLRLSKIVDGLTLLSHADSGNIKLKKETVQLHQLVRDLSDDTVMLAEPAGIRVQLTACDECVVNGDAHRLRQLLLNLADNAVKYNEPGGTIAISLLKKGNLAQFAMSNSGAGVPSELLPRVFDRFFRGDPAHNSEIEGCGLGLSIAQWITSAHGGKIQMESIPGQLTTVTITLPFHQK